MKCLLLLLTLLLTLGGSAMAEQRNLTFMLVTSFGQFGFNSSGIVPAADMALENINNNPRILQGYRLVYGKVWDSQCHRGKSLDDFFEGIQPDPAVKLAVIGCGCSVATVPVAEISHRWNISQISYASTSGSLSDRSRFKRYFRNTINMNIASPALHSTMMHFNWTRIALLTQDEGLFTAAESSFRSELEPAGINMESRIFKTTEDPVEAIKDLFSEDLDYRVFVLNSYSGPAKKIICHAQRQNYTYPKYAWIAYDWYPKRWWAFEESNIEVSCSDSELAEFLDKVISFRWRPVPDDRNATTDAGITPMDFEEQYEIRAKKEGYNTINHGIGLYDVIWVLAFALNKTITMINGSKDITDTGCQDLPGRLVPLEDFTYANERMGCLIQWNLQNTNFSGLTGHIVFDESGTRIHSTVQLLQYTYQGGTNVVRERFAMIREDDNFTFIYEPGIDDTDVYPGNPPPDGTPKQIIHTIHIWLAVVLGFLALLGITLAAVCFLFTFIYRDRKIVRLTSPKLNYIIIIGAILMYLSLIFNLVPTISGVVAEAMCILEHWLFTIGYSLAFGAVLAKMWRVFHIFHNPKPKKKILKDWLLIVISLTVCGIVVFLLLLETIVPHLRGSVVLERDSEDLYGRDSLGVREEYFIWVCYEVSSPNFFWKIFIFTYLGVLQIVGIVLAFQTRKVKVPGLKDSKFIATVVYISSIVLVALALVTFALRTYINISSGIRVAGIFTMTTMILVLIFIPKMVLLYRDPHGETVTTVTQVPSVISNSAPSLKRKSPNNKEWEIKISTLERAMDDKDKTIAQLWEKIRALTKENKRDAALAEDSL